MALLNPYCTVAEVREELRNQSTSSVSDATIEASINEASRWIDDWKGRDYFLHDYSAADLALDQYDAKFVDPFDGKILRPPFTPIITVTSITVAGSAWVANTDYVVKKGPELGADHRIISLNGNWMGFLAEATDQIVLRGTFGYAQATAASVPTGIPLFITKAAILVAAAFTGHNQKSVVGLDGNKNEVIDKCIPKVVFDILGKRRPIL